MRITCVLFGEDEVSPQHRRYALAFCPASYGANACLPQVDVMSSLHGRRGRRVLLCLCAFVRVCLFVCLLACFVPCALLLLCHRLYYATISNVDTPQLDLRTLGLSWLILAQCIAFVHRKLIISAGMGVLRYLR